MGRNNMWSTDGALMLAQRRVAEVEKQLDRYGKLRNKDAEQYNEMRTRTLTAELKAEGYEEFFLWAKAAYPEIVDGYEAVKKLEQFATQPDPPLPGPTRTSRFNFGWSDSKFYGGSDVTKVWFDELNDDVVYDSLTQHPHKV